MNKQLTDFLYQTNIITASQSGFRPGHGCITATLKVLNDIALALDNKMSCAAVFIDLAKAFDTVDHSILSNKLADIGIRNNSLGWFTNYLSDRSQYLKSDLLMSQPLPVTRGVPQGSILGPTLFSLYINQVSAATRGSSIHLYADDTILYTSGPSPEAVAESLQESFNTVQKSLSSLKLVLNTNKTKVMWFGRKSNVQSCTFPNITTSNGTVLEQVPEYKYLGIWLDSCLSFSQHINRFQSKIQSKLGFLYRMRTSITSSVRKTLVQMTILPMLDYGDIIYIDQLLNSHFRNWMLCITLLCVL